jgi:PAS domain-containing protein
VKISSDARKIAGFLICITTRIVATVTFRCPTIRDYVQQGIDDDLQAGRDSFTVVNCPACGELHFVNRKTHRLLGQKREQSRVCPAAQLESFPKASQEHEARPDQKGRAMDERSDLADRIIDQTADAMIYAGRSGTIIRWNTAASALFGYSVE